MCVLIAAHADNLLILLHCRRKTAIQHNLWSVSLEERDFSIEAETFLLSSIGVHVKHLRKQSKMCNGS